ncbi:hypothetical protein [Streptomyces olivaceoviridis]
MTLALAVVLAMQKMAGIVALVIAAAAETAERGWRGVIDPPVRMV